MQMNVKLTDAEYEKLLEKAKDEVRRELTHEALEKHLKEDFHLMSIMDFLRLFNLYGKAEELEEKKVHDLTRNEKMILALTWFGYESLLRR